MKIISLLQPWTTLWAIEEKIYETRSWATKHRGELGVHASKNDSRESRAVFTEYYFRKVFNRLDIYSLKDLPHGAIIATCELVDCIPITPEFIASLSEKEIAFGDYTPGRFAWKVENMKLLPEPIPAKGNLGLWKYKGPLPGREL